MRGQVRLGTLTFKRPHACCARGGPPGPTEGNGRGHACHQPGSYAECMPGNTVVPCRCFTVALVWATLHRSSEEGAGTNCLERPPATVK